MASGKIEMSISDLMLFQGGFAVCLSRALAEAGAVDRVKLAEHLENWGQSNPPHPAKELINAIAKGIRDDDAMDPANLPDFSRLH